MKYRVIITNEARQDELNGYNYYEEIRTGLGEDFLLTLEMCYNALAKNPHLYSYIDNKNILKDVKIARFPYVIIFEISGNNVIVFSVHNTAQQPKF